MDETLSIEVNQVVVYDALTHIMKTTDKWTLAATYDYYSVLMIVLIDETFTVLWNP